METNKLTKKKMSRKERERILHREEILQYAEQLFAQNGFIGTTMQMIADASEFSMGKLYQFFTSKDEIYFTILDAHFNKLFNILVTEVKSSDAPERQLVDFMKKVYKYFKEHHNFFLLASRCFSEEDFCFKELHSGRIRKHFDTLEKFLISILRKGIKKEVFKKYSPETLAKLMVAWIRVGFSPGTGKKEENLENIISIILTGILAE